MPHNTIIPICAVREVEKLQSGSPGPTAWRNLLSSGRNRGFGNRTGPADQPSRGKMPVVFTGPGIRFLDLMRPGIEFWACPASLGCGLKVHQIMRFQFLADEDDWSSKAI